MIALCSNYPLEVKDELMEYDVKLCEYFGVNRNPPQTKVLHMYMYVAAGWWLFRLIKQSPLKGKKCTCV